MYLSEFAANMYKNKDEKEIEESSSESTQFVKNKGYLPNMLYLNFCDKTPFEVI